MKVLSARLKWLREKHRYGQKEVASEIGITTSGYQKLEYGDSNPKLEVLVKIAQFYNVTTDFLLGLSDDTEKLREIYSSIYEVRDSIAQNKSLSDQLYREIQDFEKFRIHLISEKDNNSAREIGEKVKELQMKKEEQEVVRYQLQNKLGENIVRYIKEIIILPKSKPWINKYLKDYYPLEVDIFHNISNEVSVVISRQEFSGTFGSYSSVEEAEIVKKYLLGKLYETKPKGEL